MHQKSLICITPRADGYLATGDSRRERPLFKLLSSKLRDYQFFSSPCKSFCPGKEHENPAGI